MIHLKYGDLCLMSGEKYLSNQYNPYTYFFEWIGNDTASGSAEYFSPRSLENPSLNSIAMRTHNSPITYLRVVGRPDVEYYLSSITGFPNLKKVVLDNDLFSIVNTMTSHPLYYCKSLELVSLKNVDYDRKVYLMDGMNTSNILHYRLQGDKIVKDESFVPVEKGDYKLLVVDVEKDTTSKHKLVRYNTNNYQYSFFNYKLRVGKYSEGSSADRYAPIIYVPASLSKVTITLAYIGNNYNSVKYGPFTFSTIEGAAKIFRSQGYDSIGINEFPQEITVGGIKYTARCLTDLCRDYKAAYGVDLHFDSKVDTQINILW